MTMKITQAKPNGGRIGGLSTSEAKREAARRNGALGGRPPRYTKQTPPTFSYPGGKARMAKLLVSLMPTEGRRYVEPFVGRGNVFWTAATELDFQGWHLNDIRTIPWLTAIRDHGHDLRVPRMTRTEYLKRWADSKQGCPYALMLSPYLTFSGAGYGAAGFKGNRKVALTASGFQQSIRMAQNIMRATSPTLTALDYKDVLQDLGEDDFCYIDPPYMDAEVGKAYQPGDLDHRELVDILVRAKYRWMLSEYDHPMYIEAFGEPILKQDTETRHGRARIECVWTSK